MKLKLTRRRFLSGTAMTAVGAAVASCTAASRPATSAARAVEKPNVAAPSPLPTPAVAMSPLAAPAAVEATATKAVASQASSAQEPAPIDLPAPKQAGGRSLLEAIKDRKSTKAFQTGSVPADLLSNLLWAAFGINRPDSGKRTAPSAMNAQEIDIYVLLAQGAYVYDPKGHKLTPVMSGDLRAKGGGAQSVKDAPVQLLYVADYARGSSMAGSKKEIYSAAHAGFIGQNVYLYCASEGLGALFYDSIDRDALKTALKLRPDQSIIFPQVVGYPKA